MDASQPSSPAPQSAADERPFAVTNRLVLSIALPMTLAYLTTPLLGLVDTAVIGQYGDAALLGGLAAGTIVFDVVFASFNFLRSGTTGLVAQAFGRGEELEERAVFWRAAAISVIAGLALVALAPAIAGLGGWLMAAEPRVTGAIDTYVRIRLLSAPAALINYTVLGYLLGRGEAKLGLAMQFLLNGANILLCIVLGLKLDWGVPGVAWATVCGEAIAAAVGLAIILARFGRMPPLSRQRTFNRPAMRAMLNLNGDIMIRSFALMGAFALFTRQGAQQGTLALAANAVLMHFFLLAGYFLDGFATAAEQLAGRAIGARYRPGFIAAVRLTAVWGFALAGATSLVVLAFGSDLIGLMTTAPAVRQEALRYLPWAALTAVSGVLAFQMDGVFIGATWSRDMRNMMLVSLAVFAAAVVVLGRLFGNHGLWCALHLFLLVRGVSLYLVMRRRAPLAFPR
jgi:MATE family multidrug resistance protein